MAAGLEGAIENAEQPAKAAKEALIESGEERSAAGAGGLIQWADPSGTEDGADQGDGPGDES